MTTYDWRHQPASPSRLAGSNGQLQPCQSVLEDNALGRVHIMACGEAVHHLVCVGAGAQRP